MKKVRSNKKKTASTKGATVLKKITAEAKRIRKAKPRKKWATCQREAAQKVK